MLAFRIFFVCIFIIAFSVFPRTITTTDGQTSAEQLTKLLHEGNYPYAQRQYEQALKSFENVLALDSNNSFAMDKIGVILFDMGHVNAGLAYFDRSLEVESNNTWTLITKDRALGLLGNYSEAIEYFDTALGMIQRA